MLLFSVACHGPPLVLGESLDQGAQGGGTVPSGTETEPQCPGAAPLRVQDTTCWPTRHVGRWHGFVTGAALYYDTLAGPFSYPSEDVLLVIDAAGTGSVTFAPPRTAEPLDAGVLDAAALAPPDAATGAGPAGRGVIEGFTYSLTELRMTGGANGARRLDPRVEFSVSLAEPDARSPAPRADAAAECDACVPPDQLRAVLLLSEDGTALRGTLATEGPTRALTAGFELIRE